VLIDPEQGKAFSFFFLSFFQHDASVSMCTQPFDIIRFPLRREEEEEEESEEEVGKKLSERR
jgi:hypothetical protein